MKWWKWVLAGTVAAACLAVLISRVSAAEISLVFRNIRIAEAVAGFGVILVSYALKALRFKILLGKAAPFGKLFGVTVAQNVIAQLVPARAGDVGYIVMVKKTGMASVGYALASLVVCRLVDLVILVAIYVGSLSALDLQAALFRDVAYVVGGCVVAGVVAVVALVIFGSHAVGSAQRLLERTRLLRLKWIRYLWDEMVAAFPHLKELRFVRHVLPIICLSVLAWAATAGWIYLIWHAVGAPLNWTQVLFIFSLAYILGLFPLFFFGGIGTMDAVNAMVLIAFGIATGQAASFTLCNRVLGALYQVGLVLIVFAMLGRHVVPRVRDESNEAATESDTNRG